MGNLIPGFTLGEDDPVRADLGQDLAVDVGFRLGDHPGTPIRFRISAQLMLSSMF